MTLLQLRTKANYHLNDTSNTRYSAAMVDSYINQAYRFYHNQLVKAGCKRVLSTDSLNIVASTAEVALPSDFYLIYKAYRSYDDRRTPMIYESGLEKTTYTDGVATGDGYFPVYDVVGTNLVLKPTPSAAETDGVYLEYWPTITEMSGDSDTPASGFSSQWQDMLPLKAAVMIRSVREGEDITNAATTLATYEVDFKKYISEITKQRKRVSRFRT